MYTERNNKYLILICFVDVLAGVFSHLLSVILCGSKLDYVEEFYLPILIIVALSTLVVDLISENLNGFFTRGYFVEFICVIKCWIVVTLITLSAMFATKTSANYSRLFISVFVFTAIIVMYSGRLIIKRIIMKFFRKRDSGVKVALVTTYDKLNFITKKILLNKSRDYYVNNIIVIDGDYVGKTVNGFTITGNYGTLFNTIKTAIIDEALINLDHSDERVAKIVDSFQKAGVTTHISLDTLNFKFKRALIEDFSGMTVVSSNANTVSHAKILQKRTMDIVGGLVGVILTLLLSVVLVPAICIESKGWPIYSQIRVGKNGRKFKIYKFRSMYQDADQRKKEFLKDNQMNGLMFKLSDDPRITKIGKFIRKTSLDEFPQFFNVLKGDMSLVGTRPPTLDEFEKYELHHKSRLSFKPGITGLWQISGRNQITDFEDVVELDNKYIANWSMSQDFYILLKTVVHIIKPNGSM